MTFTRAVAEACLPPSAAAVSPKDDEPINQNAEGCTAVGQCRRLSLPVQALAPATHGNNSRDLHFFRINGCGSSSPAWQYAKGPPPLLLQWQRGGELRPLVQRAGLNWSVRKLSASVDWSVYILIYVVTSSDKTENPLISVQFFRVKLWNQNSQDRKSWLGQDERDRQNRAARTVQPS